MNKNARTGDTILAFWPYGETRQIPPPPPLNSKICPSLGEAKLGGGQNLMRFTVFEKSLQEGWQKI